ncbi:MAG TPA: DUF309 domain-containing protein [Candidatus Thermoplasmatota archaeon]|nr:DUF309 domain-containing protein [Candidatus Thermoplasmatota archaeon]
MPKGTDPRADPPPVEAVPALLRQGAAEWNAARFWHAHEAWESAWHALRKAGRIEAAAYVKGMIVVAAALENATRGKEAGFKRQFAEGLHALKTNGAGASALGLADPRAWEDALTVLYADAMRRRAWEWWRGSGWAAPVLAFA